MKNTDVAQVAGKLISLRKVWASAEHVTYEGLLEVKRDSGIADTIVILLEDPNAVETGKYYDIVGQFRSRDVDRNGKLKVELYIYVQKITTLPIKFYNNEITLTGYICKKPTLRNTPSGKQISDLLVACNYSEDKSAYIPVISWGKGARRSGKLQVGTLVIVRGRLQSRTYKKEIDGTALELTAYELSATSVEPLMNVD